MFIFTVLFVQCCSWKLSKPHDHYLRGGKKKKINHVFMILINISYMVSATQAIISLGCYRLNCLNADWSTSRVTNTAEVFNYKRFQHFTFPKYSLRHFDTYIYLKVLNSHIVKLIFKRTYVRRKEFAYYVRTRCYSKLFWLPACSLTWPHDTLSPRFTFTLQTYSSS